MRPETQENWPLITSNSTAIKIRPVKFLSTTMSEEQLCPTRSVLSSLQNAV